VQESLGRSPVEAPAGVACWRGLLLADQGARLKRKPSHGGGIGALSPLLHIMNAIFFSFHGNIESGRTILCFARKPTVSSATFPQGFQVN